MYPCAVLEAHEANTGHWLGQRNPTTDADVIQLNSSLDRTRETPSATLDEKTN